MIPCCEKHACRVKQGLCHTPLSVPHRFFKAFLVCWRSRCWTALCPLRRHRTGSNVGLLLLCTSLAKGDFMWEDLVCVQCAMAEFVFFCRERTFKSLVGTFFLEKNLQRDCWTLLLFMHTKTKLWLCYLIQSPLSCCVYWGLCYNVFSLSDDDKGMVCDLCKGYFCFSSYITYDFILH